MRFDILTLFPGFFESPFQYGVLQRALREGKLHIQAHDLRQYTHDRHRTVDDRPFGGGEGMVLKPGPIFECAEALGVTPKAQRDPRRESVVLLSAAGRPFTQPVARDLATLDRVVLLCGRYEGVDERVTQMLCDRELSVGDFVLTGGELAAALIVDAVARLLPGVLGHADSSRFESFGENLDEGVGESPGERSEKSREPGGEREQQPRATGGAPLATHSAGGLLDYPHYTRPAVFRGWSIPEELAGGDHQRVRRWRRRAALERTLRNRPDLLPTADLSPQDRRVLEQLHKESDNRTSPGHATP